MEQTTTNGPACTKDPRCQFHDGHQGECELGPSATELRAAAAKLNAEADQLDQAAAAVPADEAAAAKKP